MFDLLDTGWVEFQKADEEIVRLLNYHQDCEIIHWSNFEFRPSDKSDWCDRIKVVIRTKS